MWCIIIIFTKSTIWTYVMSINNLNFSLHIIHSLTLFHLKILFIFGLNLSDLVPLKIISLLFKRSF